jgi:hypothetical protein
MDMHCAETREGVVMGLPRWCEGGAKVAKLCANGGCRGAAKQHTLHRLRIAAGAAAAGAGGGGRDVEADAAGKVSE